MEPSEAKLDISQVEECFICCNAYKNNCYTTNCCKNNVGVVNYILDLCAVDYCYGVKRPSLKSNGKYCKNKQLFVRNSDLLSFMIINNNPFRYELEVNHKDISLKI